MSATGQSYVGKIDGTKSLLAIQVDGNKASAYYCDSAKQWGTLDGTVSGNDITASGGTDTLKGTVNGDTITGTITIDGTSHNFTAPKTKGQGGVYVQDVKSGDTSTATAWVRDDRGATEGGTFTVNTAKLGELSSVIAAGKKFSPAELTTIAEILKTGVVPSVPASSTVPADAQPLSLLGAARCGIAGFKFKRAQSAITAAGEFPTGAQNAAFQGAIDNLNSACGIRLGAT